MTAQAPFQVLAKPIGPICNLECSYCFYRGKRRFFRIRGADAADHKSFRLRSATLERFIEQRISAQPRGQRELQFIWQGGEPTLLGIDFFRAVVELQKRHARPDLAISNALQTNGILLDDEWAAFFSQHDFLVGISIDGPQPEHDRYRVDRQAVGTHDQVVSGIETLKRHGVHFNTLTVLHRENTRDPTALYDSLKALGSTHLQFIPIVEHAETPNARAGATDLGKMVQYRGVTVSRRSVEPLRFGMCLAEIFERWLECGDVGEIFVQLFDVLLTILCGYPSPLCVHAETCGRGVVLEHDGDVFSCDHYVSSEYRLGNIHDVHIRDLVESEQQRSFGSNKRDSLTGHCRRCQYLALCGGACPKDRIIDAPDGEPGLSYLCEGYKYFYRTSLPVLREMAECLQLGYPARDYRRLPQLRAKRALESAAFGGSHPAPKVGRNAPCPCGSGKKFKRCCER